ncbi:hypothetical protein DICVIV_11287 [Dictyocaulus viviparus]|uniref:Uncharacterized protein n=1 Tax=Dictyocaulus viviparus TaxID=29172 RepID=A0A0D8XG87_DICVI|nr:hypothetical protein DICVIV_11287 [Dictyocaulus viviparus]
MHHLNCLFVIPGVSSVSAASSFSQTSEAITPKNSIAAGSILSGVSAASVESSRTLTAAQAPSITDDSQSTQSTVSAPQLTSMASIGKYLPEGSTVNESIGHQFVIPPEFYKVSCKLDTTVRPLEVTKETEAIEAELRRIDSETAEQKAIRERNRWALMSDEERRVKPAKLHINIF